MRDRNRRDRQARSESINALALEVMHWFLPTLHRDKSTSWIPMSSPIERTQHNQSGTKHITMSIRAFTFPALPGKCVFCQRLEMGRLVMMARLSPVNLFTVHDDAVVYSNTVNACPFCFLLLVYFDITSCAYGVIFSILSEMNTCQMHITFWPWALTVEMLFELGCAWNDTIFAVYGS